MTRLQQLQADRPRGTTPRSRRQKRHERDQRRSCKQPRVHGAVTIDRLQKLGGQWWSPSQCIRTLHMDARSDLRHITWHEIEAAWLLGDWSVDEDDPDTFIAIWDRC